MGNTEKMLNIELSNKKLGGRIEEKDIPIIVQAYKLIIENRSLREEEIINKLREV